jgi:hypothetical protein
MRIPDPPSDDHMSMTSSEDEHTRSAQRRNLLVIVGVAAVLSVAAWAVGRIDHEFEMRTYTRRWQEADCRVLDKRMEVDGVPQGPPEIDIPDEQVVSSPRPGQARAAESAGCGGCVCSVSVV